MSRKVQVQFRDETIGIAELPSEFPADPPLFAWRGRYFTWAGTGAGGDPGALPNEWYQEITVLALPDGAITISPNNNPDRAP
jgi:hypothetical protein